MVIIGDCDLPGVKKPTGEEENNGRAINDAILGFSQSDPADRKADLLLTSLGDHPRLRKYQQS